MTDEVCGNPKFILYRFDRLERTIKNIKIGEADSSFNDDS